jgi:hypothetical protein
LKVRFATTGKVAGVSVFGAFNGRQITCVVNHVKELQIDPFQGDAPAATYTIVPRP